MNRYVFALAALLSGLLAVRAPAQQGSFDRTLTVNGPVQLDVSTNSGGITVRPGAAGTVTVHGMIRPGSNRGWLDGDLTERIRNLEKNPPIRQAGNVITIDPLPDEWLRRRLSIRYEIVAPPETAVRSRTGSGGVLVEGLLGPVEASTGSGPVTLTRIHNPVRAHTGSGRIELTAIDGNVDAHTGSGTIAGSGLAGRIVARTGSGRVDLEQTASAPVNAHTGSGGVTLRLVADSGFDVRARTGSGRVQVNHPITVRGKLGTHELQGKVRGGGPLVDVSTGSGQVRID